MATKRKATSTNKRSNDFGVDFVSFRLTEAEKKELHDNPPAEDAIFAEITRMVDNGFKFTLGFNERNQAYIATFTGPKDPTTGRKKAVSGFADDPTMACISAVYKCVQLTDGGNWDLNEITNEWGSFG